jgi:hypothetical protein
MPMRLRDLTTWRGVMGRGDYAKWGLTLFAIKYNLDRLMATTGFHRAWYIWDYVEPGRNFDAQWQRDPWFALTLFAMSIPFVVVGFAMTLRRLRDIGWSPALGVMFFAPLLNLLFFLLLCLAPSAADRLPGATGSDPRRWWEVENKWGAASITVGLIIAFVLPLVVFSTTFLQSYGLGLFIGLPFSTGFFGTLIYSAARPRSFGECLAVSFAAAGIAGLLILILAVEGVFCLVMYAPLGAAMTFIGGLFGYMVQRTRWANVQLDRVYGVAWLVVPLLMMAEARISHPLPLIEATTRVEIDAPPEIVWTHVVTFSELPPPSDWVFRSGIAYPVRARIEGSGVGAIRRCEFSTGPFVEPITAWEEPGRLAFDVVQQPHPMRELSPYRAIAPAHLEGFFRSRRGQFLLTRLPGGRTLLSGTTWYEQDLWPNHYWRFWSDSLVHRIHRRVLEHIKHESESAGRN